MTSGCCLSLDSARKQIQGVSLCVVKTQHGNHGHQLLTQNLVWNQGTH